jgi:RNA polymerase-binding transcription factor DksA
MAKKTARTSKKKAAKKSTARASTAKKTAKKKTTKKSTKKAAAKKTTKKSTKTTTKKAAAKKSSAKKTTKKAATKKKPAKKAATKTTKKTTKNAAAKKTTKKKSTKTTTKKAAASKAAPAKSDAKADASKSTDKPGDKKDDKKGPQRRSGSRKKAPVNITPPNRPLLLGPGSLLSGGPLIKSEKRSTESKTTKKKSRRKKSPLTQTQLDNYRLILLQKRAELVGDVQNLEDEALRSSSGETRTASNAAEFGTDSFDQSMNLDLAAADRKLIEKIDAALERIANNTYGLCTVSNEPIAKARLDELPWAEHSIETARKLDNPYG